MVVGQKIEIDILSEGMNGEGVAKADGIVIFVPQTMVGEKVLAEITAIKKSFAIAKVIKIIEPSQYRVIPECKICFKCGGCEMLHIDYNHQLEIKKQNVKNCIDKECRIDSKVDDVVASPKRVGYRNKIQLPVTRQNNQVVAGYFAQDSHKVIPFCTQNQEGKCLLNDEAMQGIITSFLNYVAKFNISTYDETNHKGLIRHLVIRKVGDKFAVCVVANGKTLPRYKEFIADLQAKGYDFSLYLSPNERKTNVIMGDEVITLFGEKVLKCNTLGVNYYVSPQSFMQINDDVRDMIYSRVGEIIENSNIDNVIDAYSGIGIMSNIFARYAKKVYAIEIVKQAVDDAKILAKANGNENKIVNICGDCAKELPAVISKLDKSIVVIDPPRKGCDKAVLDSIIKAGPTKIIYISCNPATLARDLKLLSDTYSIDSITPYDMFPQTKHVETLVVLSKK